MTLNEKWSEHKSCWNSFVVAVIVVTVDDGGCGVVHAVQTAHPLHHHSGSGYHTIL